MKLLKLEIEGVSIFKNGKFTLDFYAENRVPISQDLGIATDVYCVNKSSNIYSQNITGIAGVNATGKTTLLNLIKLALQMFSHKATFRSFGEEVKMRMGKVTDELKINMIFSVAKNLYLIESEVNLRTDAIDYESYFSGLSFTFIQETLWQANSSKVNRKSLSTFESFKETARIILKRNGDTDDPLVIPDEARRYIRDDSSIAMIATDGAPVLVETRNRELPTSSFSTAVVQAFDPSIERLNWDDSSGVYKLKFKNEPERTVSSEVATAMLSRGTVQGTEIVTYAVDVLQKGGFLVIDEIEEGLNRALVTIILELFASPVTNPHGAQLIFSTHYPQLLDSIHRKDNVYLLVRDLECKTEVVKLSDKVKRIELKKSEIVQSDLIKGATPNYPNVQALREYVRDCVSV